MERTAADYERLSTDRIGEFTDETCKGAFENLDTLKESQVYATLAVAQTLEKVWDQLSYINRKLTSDGNIRS